MTEVEQDHIVDAYTFELGKVEVPAVVERMVAPARPRRRGARPAGLRRPRAVRPRRAAAEADRRRSTPDATGGVDASPALAMVTEDTFPVDGRVVHILANDGADLAGIRTLRDSLLRRRASSPT